VGAKWTQIGAPFASLKLLISKHLCDLASDVTCSADELRQRFGGKDERQYGGLCRVLSRRDRLGVDVDRGTQRGMSQEFFHDFEFRPYAPQQGRVCVAERVPANPLIDPESFCNGSNNPAEDRLSPVRMASSMVLIGKNPVIGFAILAASLH